MRRFEVIADGAEVGWSRFEGGDAPMGVVFGVLHTEPPGLRVDWAAASLSVRAEDGSLIDTENSSGVFVEDHREELGDETAIEVRILGLAEASYLRHFPDHVAAYRRSL